MAPSSHRYPSSWACMRCDPKAYTKESAATSAISSRRVRCPCCPNSPLGNEKPVTYWSPHNLRRENCPALPVAEIRKPSFRQPLNVRGLSPDCVMVDGARRVSYPSCRLPRHGFGMDGRDALGERRVACDGTRQADKIALYLFAAFAHEECPLVLGFDALGDYRHLQRVA
jgi:hypothetical protein